MDSNYFMTKRYETNEMFNTWNDLAFWDSGEYQVVLENLRLIRKSGRKHCPLRRDIFTALRLTPFKDVKCVIVGQDPYPTLKHATGVAFSIPPEEKEYPPTLINIFTEYVSDTGLPWPKNGDLTKWTEQGVLLLNATPTCQEGMPGSHSHWPEWPFFTSEVIQRLSLEGRKVFVLLGRRAQMLDCNISDRNLIITASHPSPLGVNKTAHPFQGSRIFTTINAKLVELGENPINWRL